MGQIAALRVSPHADGTAVHRRHIREIIRGELLGADGLCEAEAEVLPPSDEGVVRAPVGHEEGIVGEDEGDGGELGDLAFLEDALESRGVDFPEAGAFQGFVHELVDEFRDHLAEVLAGGVFFPHGLPDVGELDGHAGGIRGDGGGEVGEAEHAENKVVDLAEGGGGKGEVPPPVEVVEDVVFHFGHIVHLPLFEVPSGREKGMKRYAFRI